MPLIQTTRGALWVADHRHPDTAPLLLIHGAGGTHLDWGMPIRKLPNLAPDLNGHGRSTGDGHFTLAEHAADMVALLDALDIGKIVVVGHSMGGGIALTMALDYPERVSSLGLISTGARMRVNPAILTRVETDPEGVAELLKAWLWGASIDEATRARGKTLFMGLKPAVIARDYAACDVFDVRQRLAEIGVPTLVLCGTADQMTPVKFSESLVSGIPNARLHLFDDAGHMLQLERAGEVAAILRPFTGMLGEQDVTKA